MFKQNMFYRILQIGTPHSTLRPEIYLYMQHELPYHPRALVIKNWFLARNYESSPANEHETSEPAVRHSTNSTMG